MHCVAGVCICGSTIRISSARYQFLQTRIPEIDARLAQQIATFMRFLREQPLQKVPGVAEALDWGMALVKLHRDALDEATLELTRGCVIKVREDWEFLRSQRERYLSALGA